MGIEIISSGLSGWEWRMLGLWGTVQSGDFAFASTMQTVNTTLFTSDPTSLGVRAGLSLFIVLVAWLLGPRIARSVSRIPAFIETVRERHANRTGANEREDEGADGGTQSDVGTAEDHAAIGAIPGAPEAPRVTSRWLGGFVLACVWIFALYLIAAIWFADQAIGTDERMTLLHALRTFALDLGVTILIIIVTLVLARALQKSLVASLRRGRVNGNLVVLAGRMVFTIIIIIGVTLILAVWGLGIVLPVTLIGALTVALSLALQDILKNLVSGVYLLLERPFVIGDRITIAPYSGVVENINIRVTALRTNSGERVLVPNGLLFSSAVINNSFYQRQRVALLVTLPDNGHDAVEATRQRILATLADVRFALRAPAPEVALSKAAGGKVDLRVILWLPLARAEENGDALAEVMERIRASLPGAEVAPLDGSAAV
jgi:small-conductance mechanosensitive channel